MRLHFRATTTLTISRLHRPQPSSSCSFDGSLKGDQLDCESKWPEVPPVLNQNEDRKRNKYLRKDYLKVWEDPDWGSILGATFKKKKNKETNKKKMHEWHWSVVDEFLKRCKRGWEITLSSSFSSSSVQEGAATAGHSSLQPSSCTTALIHLQKLIFWTILHFTKVQ